MEDLEFRPWLRKNITTTETLPKYGTCIYLSQTIQYMQYNPNMSKCKTPTLLNVIIVVIELI